MRSHRSLTVCCLIGLLAASAAQGADRKKSAVVAASHAETISDDGAGYDMSAAYGGGGCGDACGVSCGDACGSCGDMCGGACFPCDSGCGSLWSHRHIIFGEYLYLRPRDAEVAYAVPIDGPITDPDSGPPIQVGPYGVVDPDYQPGYRVGLNLALDPCRSIFLSYSQLESSTTDSIARANDDIVIHSNVAHPSSESAETDFNSATATHDIDYNLADFGLRHILMQGNTYAVNYEWGGRYAKLEQNFNSQFINNEIETVTTDLDFEGGGIRLGLDGQRMACRSCWHAYGKTAASFVGGEFNGTYFQGTNFDPVIVSTDWRSGRVVTILDFEAGLGWTSPGGCLTFSAGYVFSTWLNAVKTNEFINAIQRNNLLNLNDGLSFDGLVARAELRF